MKRIIVMLLVLAVFVGGVFADVKAGKNEGADVTVSNESATMTMKYTPYANTAYYIIGFDVNGDKVTNPSDANAHLVIADHFAGDTALTLTPSVVSQKVTGSHKFNIFYEIVTTESLSLDLAFASEFVGTTNSDVKFNYDVYTGDSAVSENKIDKEVPILKTAGKNWVKGTQTYFVQTEDVSTKVSQEYTAVVTLKLTATT